MTGQGETGDPRENPPTSGIVRHYSYVRKFGDDHARKWNPLFLRPSSRGTNYFRRVDAEKRSLEYPLSDIPEIHTMAAASSRHIGGEETGDPRENLPTSGIVRHYSHLRKSGVKDRARFALMGGDQSNRSETVATL
ncbi:hypothetical protein PR048_000589, partial [Dryococelus australis]